MHSSIVAIGSHGDVAPSTGPGARLRDEGHRVAVVTHALHETMISEAGLGFRAVPGHPLGAWKLSGTGPERLATAIRRALDNPAYRDTRSTTTTRGTPVPRSTARTAPGASHAPSTAPSPSSAALADTRHRPRRGDGAEPTAHP